MRIFCADCGTENSKRHRQCRKCGSDDLISMYDMHDRYLSLLCDRPFDGEFMSFVSRVSCESFVQICERADEKGGNLNFSPISLCYAVAMLLAGAKAEIVDDFLSRHGSGNASWEQISTGFSSFLKIAIMNANAVLRLSNLLATQEGITFTEEGREFERTLSSKFGAVCKAVNYRDNASEVLSRWISDCTNGLLKPSLRLPANTVSTLLNTIYLKCSWGWKFDKCETDVGPFRGNGETFDTPYMCDKRKLWCCVGDEHRRLTLNCEGDFRVKLVLPDEGVRLSRIVCDAQKLRRVLVAEDNANVDASIRLPRFDIRSDIDLTKVLGGLGLADMLDESCTAFRNLYEKPIFIENVRQESRIKVDEEGLEGAAFTIMAVCAGCRLDPGKLKELDFHFDRPFFYSVETREGIPVFMGIVAQPERAE